MRILICRKFCSVLLLLQINIQGNSLLLLMLLCLHVQTSSSASGVLVFVGTLPEPKHKTRRWGSTHTVAKDTSVSISTDSLKVCSFLCHIHVELCYFN